MRNELTRKQLQDTNREWHLTARKGGKIVRLTGTYRKCRYCKESHPALFLDCPNRYKKGANDEETQKSVSVLPPVAELVG